MSRNRKRTMIVAIVTFVAIWPAIQMALVHALRVDPWELFGWAMYSVPQARYEIGIERKVDGEWSSYLPPGSSRRQFLAFGRHRAILGDLSPLAPYASELLEANPQVQGLAIIERRWWLDRASARIAYGEERHEFD